MAGRARDVAPAAHQPPSAATTTVLLGAGATHRPPRRESRRAFRGNGSATSRARSIVTATGAHERPVVFADNDWPASCSPARPAPTCTADGVLPRSEVVVFTTQRQRLRPASTSTGPVRIRAVIDARPAGSGTPHELEPLGSPSPTVPSSPEHRGPDRAHRRPRRPTAQRRGRRAFWPCRANALLISGSEPRRAPVQPETADGSATTNGWDVPPRRGSRWADHRRISGRPSPSPGASRTATGPRGKH